MSIAHFVAVVQFLWLSSFTHDSQKIHTRLRFHPVLRDLCSSWNPSVYLHAFIFLCFQMLTNPIFYTSSGRCPTRFWSPAQKHPCTWESSNVFTTLPRTTQNIIQTSEIQWVGNFPIILKSSSRNLKRPLTGRGRLINLTHDLSPLILTYDLMQDTVQ